MIFTRTALEGLWQVDLERRADERGFFARSYCGAEFAAHGLPAGFLQCNVSFNARRGTLRGMHWQAEPHPEGKLVRCTRGAVFDVAVDVRAESATLHRWVGVELTAENGRALYIPGGFAHGFLTLEDATEVFYQMSETYHPECARGARWDDPAFGISWPGPPLVISGRDLEFAPT